MADAVRPETRRQISKSDLARPGVIIRLLILAAVVAWIVYLFPPKTNWPMWLAAAGWIGFSIYWSVAARQSAEAKSAESAQSRRTHLILTNLGELLLFLPVPGLQGLFRPAAMWWIVAGLLMLFLSIALAVWARRHLGKNWSGRIDIKKEHELVRSGPYRLLRHPIYTAVFGMCVGTALVNGKLHALLGIAIVVIAYWRKVRMEEANMRDAFGAQYDEYRSATLGAIPGLF